MGLMETCEIPWNAYRKAAEGTFGVKRMGRVKQVVGLLIEGQGPQVSIGEMCEVMPDHGPPIKAEVVGFRSDAVLLMPLGSLSGVHPGSPIISQGHSEIVAVGDELLGRVIGPMGDPMDGRSAPYLDHQAPLYADPINPMLRRRIDTPLDLASVRVPCWP